MSIVIKKKNKKKTIRKGLLINYIIGDKFKIDEDQSVEKSKTLIEECIWNIINTKNINLDNFLYDFINLTHFLGFHKEDKFWNNLRFKYKLDFLINIYFINANNFDWKFELNLLILIHNWNIFHFILFKKDHFINKLKHYANIILNHNESEQFLDEIIIILTNNIHIFNDSDYVFFEEILIKSILNRKIVTFEILEFFEYYIDHFTENEYKIENIFSIFFYYVIKYKDINREFVTIKSKIVRLISTGINFIKKYGNYCEKLTKDNIFFYYLFEDFNQIEGNNYKIEFINLMYNLSCVKGYFQIIFDSFNFLKLTIKLSSNFLFYELISIYSNIIIKNDEYDLIKNTLFIKFNSLKGIEYDILSRFLNLLLNLYNHNSDFVLDYLEDTFFENLEILISIKIKNIKLKEEILDYDFFYFIKNAMNLYLTIYEEFIEFKEVKEKFNDLFEDIFNIFCIYGTRFKGFNDLKYNFGQFFNKFY